MWMWEKYTLLHWLFFYYRGEAGAPTITASSSQVRRGDVCWEECTGEGKENRRGEGRNCGKRQENANRKSICRNIYLKAPQGLNMSFPQYHWMKVQSLENLMEREKRDFELALCVCSSV